MRSMEAGELPPGSLPLPHRLCGGGFPSPRLRRREELFADGDRQNARADVAEQARTEIEPERPHLVALAVAAKQIARRRLPFPRTPAVERIEGDQRNEHAPAADFDELHVGAG